MAPLFASVPLPGAYGKIEAPASSQGEQPLVLHYLYPLSLVGEHRHGMGHLARLYGPPAPEGSLQQRLYAGIDGLNYLL